MRERERERVKEMNVERAGGKFGRLCKGEKVSGVRWFLVVLPHVTHAWQGGQMSTHGWPKDLDLLVNVCRNV